MVKAGQALVHYSGLHVSYILHMRLVIAHMRHLEDRWPGQNSTRSRKLSELLKNVAGIRKVACQTEADSGGFRGHPPPGRAGAECETMIRLPNKSSMEKRAGVLDAAVRKILAAEKATQDKKTARLKAARVKGQGEAPPVPKAKRKR